MSVRSRIDDGVLVVTIDNPPVNGLSLAVRTGLCTLLEQARRSPDIVAVVIHGAGRCFCAGGDINEIGTPAGMATPGLSLHVHPAIEQCGKPVIAALHGLALGGGLETALACNYRIASANTRLAMPEVNLGIIPLSGTQRLPRLIGLQQAIEMIVEAREHVASDLRDSDLFDRVIDDSADLLAESIRFARDATGNSGSLPLVRDRPLPDRDPQAIIRAWRAKIIEDGASDARRGALEAIAAIIEEPDFDVALARARDIYDRLYSSPATVVAREAFLARRRKTT